MAKIVVNKVDEIYKRLESENRLSKVSSNSQTKKINEQINDEIREFRRDFSKKEKQSQQDANDTILNA